MVTAAAIVLMLHPGSFVQGSPADLDDAARALRQQGIAAKSVSYQLGKPAAALEDVRAAEAREERRGRKVIWVGTSAGATLALRMAQTGRPYATIAYAPVADVTHWHAQPKKAARMLTPRQRWIVDPSRHSCRHESRTVILHSRADELVPFAPSARYARRCPHTTLYAGDGDHESYLNPLWRPQLGAFDYNEYLRRLVARATA